MRGDDDGADGSASSARRTTRGAVQQAGSEDDEDENEEENQDVDSEEEEDDEGAEQGKSDSARITALEKSQQKHHEETQLAIENLGRLIGNLARSRSSKDQLGKTASGSNEYSEDEDSEDEEMQGAYAKKGQSKSFKSTGLFPWLDADIIEKVLNHTLKPEKLICLRNIDSTALGEEVVEDRPIRVAGLPVEYETTIAAQNTAFVKAIPNYTTFVQVWTPYAGILAYHSDDPALGPALMQFLGRISELNNKYYWKEGVAPYIAMCCRHRFGVASAKTWTEDDQKAWNSHIEGNKKDPKASSSQQASSSGSSSSSSNNNNASKKKKSFSVSGQPYSGTKPGGGNGGPCQRFNMGQSCTNCLRPHVCSVCRGYHSMSDCPSIIRGNRTDDDDKPKKKQKP